MKLRRIRNSLSKKDYSTVVSIMIMIMIMTMVILNDDNNNEILVIR